MLYILIDWQTSDSHYVVASTLALAWLAGHTYVTQMITSGRWTKQRRGK